MTEEVAPQAIRKLKPGKLVIASHNQGKVREILEMLAPYGIEPVSAADLDLPEPEETGTTFLANAELKALQAADLTGLPVDRPVVTETTALGAAYLAGLGAGLFRNERDIASRWALDRRFTPKMKKAQRDLLHRGWRGAVARVQ